MKADWLVDKDHRWEIIGLVYENGKLAKIRLQQHPDPFDQSGDPPQKATIRVLNGQLHAERDRV